MTKDPDLEAARADIAALHPHLTEADLDEVMSHICVTPKYSDEEIRRLALEMARSTR